jgi:hypothetical protein
MIVILIVIKVSLLHLFKLKKIVILLINFAISINARFCASAKR